MKRKSALQPDLPPGPGPGPGMVLRPLQILLRLHSTMEAGVRHPCYLCDSGSINAVGAAQWAPGTEWAFDSCLLSKWMDG